MRPWVTRSGSCRERWMQVRAPEGAREQGSKLLAGTPGLLASRGGSPAPGDASPGFEPAAIFPAGRRPKNSALEVDLDFDTTVKPPPQVGMPPGMPDLPDAAPAADVCCKAAAAAVCNNRAGQESVGLLLTRVCGLPAPLPAACYSPLRR